MREDQMLCPSCGKIAECDSVDVGVGLMLRGNFNCECGWEIDGPEDYLIQQDIENLEFAPSEVFCK